MQLRAMQGMQAKSVAHTRKCRKNLSLHFSYVDRDYAAGPASNTFTGASRTSCSASSTGAPSQAS